MRTVKQAPTHESFRNAKASLIATLFTLLGKVGTAPEHSAGQRWTCKNRSFLREESMCGSMPVRKARDLAAQNVYFGVESFQEHQKVFHFFFAFLYVSSLSGSVSPPKISKVVHVR